jgi:hypothetical protein
MPEDSDLKFFNVPSMTCPYPFLPRDFFSHCLCYMHGLKEFNSIMYMLVYRVGFVMSHWHQRNRCIKCYLFCSYEALLLISSKVLEFNFCGRTLYRLQTDELI